MAGGGRLYLMGLKAQGGDRDMPRVISALLPPFQTSGACCHPSLCQDLTSAFPPLPALPPAQLIQSIQLKAVWAGRGVEGRGAQRDQAWPLQSCGQAQPVGLKVMTR